MRHEGHLATARTSGVVVKAVGDEVLVYDLEQHRAHSLNALAAAVWRACDGTRDALGLGAAVEREIGQPVPLEAVRYAVQSLGRARLLMAPVGEAGLTRRDLIRRLGTATAVAVPIVASITAPRPAAAQSCIASGDACVTSSTCCPCTPPATALCNGGACRCAVPVGS